MQFNDKQGMIHMYAHRIRQLLLSPVALGVALCGFTATGAAEETAQESTILEEILVTARKREERMQDVPTSGAALSRGLLEVLNPVEDIRELTDLVPGITVNDVNL